MRALDEIPRRLLVAIGGNAIHPDNIRGTSEEQKAIAAGTARALLPLAQLDNELVITHGNGPVVGKILMRQALTRDRIAPMSLDICVAHSQGGIAYLLMQALENALREADDARHVVPSPKPRHIVDISLIQVLAGRGTVVIAGGGGGIPVVRGPKGVRHGVRAVIDKDLTSALMAKVLGIEELMILTAVPKVAIHYGTPEQRELDRVSLREIKALHAEGHFPPGSMGPKIEAAVRFLEGGGERVIIGHLEQAMAALTGETGTHIVADDG